MFYPNLPSSSHDLYKLLFSGRPAREPPCHVTFTKTCSFCPADMPNGPVRTVPIEKSSLMSLFAPSLM